MLPPEVRALAARLGATEDRPVATVRLTQRGTMREGPGSRDMPFRAMQTIDLRRPGFEWRASTGPFGCVSVLDRLQDGEAALEVRALGLFRIAGVRGGASAAKGEVMRYLAELAWAPDAILHNPALVWTVVDHRTLRVGAGHGLAQGVVELRLDENGRIGSVRAEDRPRWEGSDFVERPWSGRFTEYRRHEGRCLPFSAEVGWVLDGKEAVVWRGTLLSWAVR